MFPSLKSTPKLDDSNVKKSPVDSGVEVIEDPNLEKDPTCSIISLPPLIKTAYEPTVLWSQNEVWITLKILLPGVVDYDLYVQTRQVKFL
jgi:hypothetical protein